MKVLFTTNIPSPYRVDFFNELGKYCDLTVTFENKFALDRNDEWKKYGFEHFNGIFLKGFRYGEAEAFCPEIVKIIKNGNFNHIIIGMYSSLTGMYAIRYMKKHKIPYILNTDGGMIKGTNGIKWKIKKYFIGSASKWLSTGESATRYLETYGAQRDSVHVYPLGSVKEEDILKRTLTKEEKLIAREKLGLYGNKIIISVGQLIHRKGYDILEEAAKDLKDFQIYIIGGEADDRDTVHYLGFMKKEKVYEYLKAADLFVLPTREDVWGLVINEALSCGLPVVTTDKCNAGLEMISDGVNGYIVPTENVEALKEAIREAVLLDPEKSIEVARKYSIEAMAKSHRDILNE